MMSAIKLSRRAFAAALVAAGAAAIPVARVLAAARQGGRHPEPRPGIDASSVVPAADLERYGDGVKRVFDQVREMPHIADGIRCYCGCAEREGMRSLLSCFSAGGMAKDCEICQGEARLAHRRFKEGQALSEIRRAIDARYS
jgi:hypothetical protein